MDGALKDLKLESTWSYWYSPRGRNSKPEAAENYETQLTHIGDVTTIHEFLSFYLYLKKPDDVATDHKMLFFRKDHSPCWEVKKKEDPHKYNLKWERLLFACVSEEFEDKNVIGLVLSVRQKKNLIEIWLKNAKDEEDRIKTGEKIRELLELEPTNLVFYFKEHQKSLKEGSTLRGVEQYSFVTTPVETPISTPQVKTVNPADVIPEIELL